MKKFLVILFLLIATQTQAADLSTTTCPGAGCFTYNIGGQGSIGIQITGTWVGTITFQGSLDGSTFTSLRVIAASDTSSAGVTTTTGNGIWNGTVAGLNNVRVVFTAYTSGTAVVSFRSTTAAAKFGSGSGGSPITIGDTQVAYATAADTIGGDAGLVYDDATNTITLAALPKLTGFVDGMWNGEDSFQIRPSNSDDISLSLITSYTDTDEWSGLLIEIDDRNAVISTLDKATFDEGTSRLNISTGSTGLNLYSNGGPVTVLASSSQPFTVNRPTNIIGASSIDGDLKLSNLSALQTGTTAGDIQYFKAYDTNLPGYVGYGIATANDAPSFVLTSSAGVAVTIRAVYQSNDGTAGLTQTCAAAVTAVTVKNGLITAITCP